MEALQVQLHRYEEETANLNRVLDEQRKGIEERDQLIRQLRTENVGYASYFSSSQSIRFIRLLMDYFLWNSKSTEFSFDMTSQRNFLFDKTICWLVYKKISWLQQKNSGGAELEKLQAEHARCSQQIQQKQQQLETLMKQLEQQAEEILTTKSVVI